MYAFMDSDTCTKMGEAAEPLGAGCCPPKYSLVAKIKFKKPEEKVLCVRILLVL